MYFNERKKPLSKSYMLYDFIYTTFYKSKIVGTKNKLVVARV